MSTISVNTSPLTFYATISGQFSLNDPVKLSELNIASGNDIMFDNPEKDFVIDQNVEMDQRIIDIKARTLFVGPKVLVSAKEIKFCGPQLYNLGELRYEKMSDCCVQRSYRGVRSSFPLKKSETFISQNHKAR